MTWHVEHATDPSQAPGYRGDGALKRRRGQRRKNLSIRKTDCHVLWMDCAPSKSMSCSCAIDRISSSSLTSTVFNRSPFESLKWTLILEDSKVIYWLRSRHKVHMWHTLFPEVDEWYVHVVQLTKRWKGSFERGVSIHTSRWMKTLYPAVWEPPCP